MNIRVAKKIRRVAKRGYKDAVHHILMLPWYHRLQWAWFVVTHHVKAKA